MQKLTFHVSTVAASPFCSICRDVYKLYIQPSYAQKKKEQKPRKAMEAGVSCICNMLYPLTSQILMCTLVPDFRIWSSEGICTLKVPELVPASLCSGVSVYNEGPEQQVGTGLPLLSYLFTGTGSCSLGTWISQPLHRPSPGEVWFCCFFFNHSTKSTLTCPFFYYAGVECQRTAT